MFDLQVSPNRPSQLLEALLEQRCSYLCLRIVGCEWDEHADASHALALLCMSGERPDHYCAAEKCDEVAPLHMHAVKDRALCGDLRLALDDVNVRFGSKADICNAKSHVRFAPESGHVRCKSRCPLWPIADIEWLSGLTDGRPCSASIA